MFRLLDYKSPVHCLSWSSSDLEIPLDHTGPVSTFPDFDVHVPASCAGSIACAAVVDMRPSRAVKSKKERAVGNIMVVKADLRTLQDKSRGD